MKQLSETWFCESPIDLEHKQYVLLDYVQAVKEDFSLFKLYPDLGDIIKHIQNIESFRKQQKFVLERMKKPVGYNWQTNEIIYEDAEPTPQLKEVNDIIDYALPNLNHWRERGQEIYDTVEKLMRWRTIGIIPGEYVDEGYFMIRMDRKTRSYRYKIEKMIMNQESYWGINLTLVDESNIRFTTYENIKNDIISRYPDLPVPLTMAVETDRFPLEETILPLVKRIGLMRIRRGIYS